MKLSTLFLLSFLVASVSSAETKTSVERIGISIPLSGPVANYGDDMRKALLFANQELANSAYQLLFEDDKCDGKNALSVATKLVQLDHVKYVIGFACSSALLSAARVYEQNHVVAITSMASAPAISEAGRYIFRTWVTSDANAARVLIQYIAAREKALGLISEETDYAQAMGEAAEQASLETNLKVFRQNYLPDSNDQRSELLKLKAQGIDALFINSQDDLHFVNILRQARQAGLQVPVYGAYFPGSAVLLKEAGSLAEGIRYVDAPSVTDLLRPEGLELMNRYTAKFGKPSFDLLVATTIEAFRAVHLAVQSGQDPVGFFEEKRFEGMFGDWHFDKNGDIEGIRPVIKVIQNGAPVTVR